jgi:hypothetical protein
MIHSERARSQHTTSFSTVRVRVFLLLLRVELDDVVDAQYLNGSLGGELDALDLCGDSDCNTHTHTHTHTHAHVL